MALLSLVSLALLITVLWFTARRAESQDSAQADPYTYVAEGQVRGMETGPEEYGVEEVSTLVCMWAHDRGESGECGDWCAPDRTTLSSYFPDRSEWVHSEEDCRDIAESFVYWQSVYPDVSLEDLLTVAYREAHFQFYAFGRGGECGTFQQYAQYARPATMRYDMGCVEREGPDYCPEDARRRICEWFFADVDNQVYSFVLKADDYNSRYGDEWPCHYRDGTDCGSTGYAYLSNHRRVRERVETALETLQSLASADTPLVE